VQSLLYFLQQPILTKKLNNFLQRFNDTRAEKVYFCADPKQKNVKPSIQENRVCQQFACILFEFTRQLVKSTFQKPNPDTL